jgi:hypothetical protein
MGYTNHASRCQSETMAGRKTAHSTDDEDSGRSLSSGDEKWRAFDDAMSHFVLFEMRPLFSPLGQPARQLILGR